MPIAKYKYWILTILIGLFVGWNQYRLNEQEPELTLIGPIKRCDGLGRNTLEFADLLRSTYNLNCIPTFYEDADISPSLKKIIYKNSKSHSWIRKIFTRVATKKWGKVVVYTDTVWELNPKKIALFDRLEADPERIKIAYSMFESSFLPQEGVDCLNRSFDLIVVPDPYLVNVYKNSGVKVPIVVLPLAIDFSTLLDIPLKQHKQRPFVFTVLSSSIYRKNILNVVKAFHAQFKNEPDVRLRINSRYAKDDTASEILRYINAHALHQVQFTQEALSTKAYNELLAQSDCILNVSMGEGFSIQPREAMVLGIPVIVSDNTAQTTICQSGLVKTVSCSISEPAIHYFSPTPCGNFFKCSEQDIGQAMQDVYTHYEDYLKNATQARAWALQYHTGHLQQAYIEFFAYKNLQNLISSLDGHD